MHINKTPKNKSPALIWAILAIIVMWLALLGASCIEPGINFGAWLDAFSDIINRPLNITFNAYSLKAVGVSLILYGFLVTMYLSSKQNTRFGEEHGSAKWGDAKQVNAQYRDRKKPDSNIILTRNVQLGMDSFRHRRNLNVLVVGGSGAGKSRFYCMPNIMQMSCSYIVTDPKGETLRALGPLFQAKGIPITVLNLVDYAQSDGYNPLEYIHTDSDVLKLVSNLIKSTTPKESKSQDPFWDKAEQTLLLALILYLFHEAPPEEQNFPMVLYMIQNAEVSEEDEYYRSPIDMLFDDLEEENPEHIALGYWKNYRNGAPKTLKSILIGAAVRLATVSLPDISRILKHDEMDFASLGERQRVIFCVIPDNDASMNYLVGMLYSQAFQELYFAADNKHGGRLPVHVRIIMDEFSNVALPDDFERILSTCRSREISINMIIQNIAQIKALFKDSWENLTGNCDIFLYLGGNEQSTHKYVSELLGKATIDTKTRGINRGRNGSSSENFQNAGRELMTPDEVRALNNDYALLFLRGEPPVIDKKYDLMKHPSISKTEHGGAGAYKHKIIQQKDKAPVFTKDLSAVFDPDRIELIEFTEETDNE